MIKHCVICGKTFNGRAKVKTCSYECRVELNRRITLQWQHDKRQQKSDSATCLICGKTFTPNFTNERFCSNKCRLNSPLYKFLLDRFGSYDLEVILDDDFGQSL